MRPTTNGMINSFLVSDCPVSSLMYRIDAMSQWRLSSGALRQTEAALIAWISVSKV